MHYEVELRQADTDNGQTGATWRVVSLVRPRAFTTLDAAQAHAGQLKPWEARVVAVEGDGSRRVVDEAGT